MARRVAGVAGVADVGPAAEAEMEIVESEARQPGLELEPNARTPLVPANPRRGMR